MRGTHAVDNLLFPLFLVITSFRTLFRNYRLHGLSIAIIWFILAGINGTAPLTLAGTTLAAFMIGAWLGQAFQATFVLSLPRVKRPFANTSRRDKFAIFAGVLVGVGLALALVWRARQTQSSIWNGLIAWGIALALAGGWLGPKLLGWVLRLPWPSLKIHIGWLAGSKFVTVLSLVGAGVGVNNVWDTADSSTPAALTAFLVRLAVWAGGLGWAGYGLGLFLLRYNSSIWKWLLGMKASKRWLMLLGALIATLFGVTVVQETAVPAQNATVITPNTVFTLLVMAVVGWLVVRWILALTNPFLRVMLEVILLGTVGGVIVIALVPVTFTSLSELLLSGGLMGTAVALLLFHRSAAMLMRALWGALLGALIAVGNVQNDPSQLAVTSWIFAGMITAVLWSRWREVSRR